LRRCPDAPGAAAAARSPVVRSHMTVIPSPGFHDAPGDDQAGETEVPTSSANVPPVL
jgi:hypothetical protein